jgi:sec-independent protein translocase protein TatB
MIEISFGKLLMIAVIALIVLGPEKLPGAARTAGALLRRVRTGWDSVRAEVERELEIEEIRRAAREAAAQAESVQSQLNAAQASVKDAVQGAVKEVDDIARSAASADAPASEAPAAIEDAPIDDELESPELMTGKPLAVDPPEASVNPAPTTREATPMPSPAPRQESSRGDT